MLLAAAGVVAVFVTAEEVKPVSVQLVVLTPDRTDTAPPQIFLASSLDEWRPGGRKLARTAPGVYATTLDLPPDTKFEFKITRHGTWPTVERTPGGEDIPNRYYVVRPDAPEQTIVCFVGSWAGLSADERRPIEISGMGLPPSVLRKSTLTGGIRYHHDFRSPQLDNERTLIVWLPPDYNEQPDRRYPVLYMHDGNNVFDAATSFIGAEWEADETADKLIRAGKIKPIIIVGIYNNAQRHEEYTPVRDANFGVGGRGDDYLAFVADTVKPFIDKTYRTQPAAERTGMCGASLGGLITLHAAFARPEVFGRCAAVSPTIAWGERAVLDTVREHADVKPVRLWIDSGAPAGAADPPAYVRDCRALVAILEAQGRTAGEDFRYEEIKGGEHTERHWAARFGQILEYLYGA